MTDEVLKRFGCDSRKASSAFAHTTREKFLATLKDLDLPIREANRAISSLPRDGYRMPRDLAVLPDAVLRRPPYWIKPAAIRTINKTFFAILESRGVKEK